MTAPQKITGPLFGYTGQPPEYLLPNGNTLAAGDLVERAAARFHGAHPGLDASQVGAAWNDLPESDRQAWCLEELRAIDSASKAASESVDLANTLATVGKSAAKMLGADLIDAALSEVKALQRPWQQMTETQQDEVLERLTSRVRAAVGDTIRMLATRGAANITCELESISIKKGAKATLVVPKGELDQDLLDAVGQTVLLVIGSPMDEAKGIPQPAADPTQRDLLGDAGAVHSDPEE